MAVWNGFDNYETLLVAETIFKNEHLLNVWKSTAKDILEMFKENAKEELAEQLRIDFALQDGEINWNQIAEKLIQEVWR